MSKIAYIHVFIHHSSMYVFFTLPEGEEEIHH